MSRRFLIILSLVLASSAFAAPAQGDVPEETGFSVSGPCTSNEQWILPETLPFDSRNEFKNFLNQKSTDARSFSEALALRKSARGQAARLFAEYWISRSLFAGKMIHVATSGFNAIAAQMTAAAALPIQAAALACLVEIHRKTPSFPFPASITNRLPTYVADSRTRPAAWAYSAALFMAQLSENRPAAELQKTLDLLKGSGAYESAALASWSARRGEHRQTIAHLEKFFALSAKSPEVFSKNFEDHANLLLARAYYTTGQFDMAAGRLKLVRKSSNELAKALTEMAWSHLLAEKYSEAIGTAMNLQAGGMRKTYAPEAPMVLAMALNELCQYPESLKAIQLFRREYEPAYRWLEKSAKQKTLYQTTIAYLKKKGDVPERVASEWVRSPLFLSLQDEINLLFEEKQSSVALGRSGSATQKQLVREIRDLARDLKPKIKAARGKMTAGEELPEAIKSKLSELRRLLTRLARLQIAAPVWRSILSSHLKQAALIERGLVARINADLQEKSARMLLQLQEIAENNQLIEVEIYNGASEDIIWQNAHPDYKEIAKKMKDDRQASSADKVWDWGRTPTTEGEGGEIWEDELGSFKANVFDNCSSKDRYLSIKRRRT